MTLFLNDLGFMLERLPLEFFQRKDNRRIHVLGFARSGKVEQLRFQKNLGAVPVFFDRDDDVKTELTAENLRELAKPLQHIGTNGWSDEKMPARYFNDHQVTSRDFGPTSFRERW